MQDRIDRLDVQKPGLLAVQAINAVLIFLRFNLQGTPALS